MCTLVGLGQDWLSERTSLSGRSPDLPTKLNFTSLLSRTSVESDTSWLHPFDALYSLSLAPLVRSQSFNLPREGGRIPHDLAHRNHDFTRLTEVAFAVTSLM